MIRIKLIHTYEDIISMENLLGAWKDFLKGKRKKKDVQEFQIRLTDNLISLHTDLKNKTYKHGGYYAFNISDPKPRNIHKASVRDRLLHHAIYRMLYPFFDKKFIFDSYSCRLNKGTHKAIDKFFIYSKKVSINNTRTCWVLKCDVRKFFASIDQVILLKILESHIHDKNTLELLYKIIDSFHSTKPKIGLPLGNLTSQLLVNIYMNEFDQFMKHQLKAHYYIRYADDFVVLSHRIIFLESLIQKISDFLKNRLKLTLHPDKVFIKTLASGIDLLGWIHFSDYRILRTTTKKRMFKNIKKKEHEPKTVQSYLGLINNHGNTYKIRQQITHDDTFRF